MAYSPGTLSWCAGTLESDFGFFVYTTADSVATVEGTNYFSDGQSRGMRQLGTLVVVLSGATPAAYVATLCQVTALQASPGLGATLTIMSAVASSATGAAEVNTAISTTGATGTLTAAAIVGGLITRSGPTAVFTDTTASAAAIIAAMTTAVIGNSWEVTIDNTTAYAEILAAGASVTLSGIGVVPPNGWARALVTYTGTGTVSMYVFAVGQSVPAPQFGFTSISTAGAISLTAAEIAGGTVESVMVFTGTNAANVAYTLPTVAATVAAMRAAGMNPTIGMSWKFTLINENQDNETLTFTADAGPTWTLSGTAQTVAQGTQRSWIMTLTSLTAGTCQSLGEITVTAAP